MGCMVVLEETLERMLLGPIFEEEDDSSSSSFEYDGEGDTSLSSSSSCRRGAQHFSTPVRSSCRDGGGHRGETRRRREMNYPRRQQEEGQRKIMFFEA